MNISKKTLQEFVDHHLQVAWGMVHKSEIWYRNSDWTMTREEYPEDNTANFYMSRDNDGFTLVIDTKPVFENDFCQSAKVLEKEETA